MDCDVYLDIDGVLLANDKFAANHVHEFLEYVTARHPTYWLTTHCRGKISSEIMSKFVDILQPETVALLQSIRPTNWDTAKTDGIDFSRPFLWFDDDLYDDEREELTRRGVLNNWVRVDLSKDIDQLKTFVISFPVPIVKI